MTTRVYSQPIRTNKHKVSKRDINCKNIYIYIIYRLYFTRKSTDVPVIIWGEFFAFFHKHPVEWDNLSPTARRHVDFSVIRSSSRVLLHLIHRHLVSGSVGQWNAIHNGIPTIKSVMAFQLPAVGAIHWCYITFI